MEAFKKALLEMGRVVVLAILPLLVSSLQQDIGIDWRAILIVAVITLLKGLDKYLHTLGEEIEKDTGEPSKYITGLVRF